MEFRGVKGRSEDENQKTEKDQAVHDAGIKILECLDLKQTVPQKELDPLIPVVPPDFRFAHGGPHLPPPVNAVSKDGHGYSGEEKKKRLKMLGIPENFSSLVAN
jgi:hypothetical protein